MLRLRHFLLIALLLFAIAPLAGATSADTSDRQEARFKLSEKVGWYRFDDGSRQLMTWGAEGGLMLSDFEAFEAMQLRPVSGELFAARDAHGDDYEIQFYRDGTGEITGFRWLDADGEERTAERLIDVPYLQREVRVRNGGVETAGLLIIPASPGPHPAVVFIPGEEDGVRANVWSLYQADYLARRGIAVFLPDRRGTGKSGGAWETASFDDLAGDAIAAARRLKGIDEIDPSRIGAIGVSEGGWIAPIAASRSKDIRFLISVSGSAVTPREQIRHEISADVRRYGTPDFLVPLIAYALEFRSTHKDETWWEQNGRFDVTEYWEKVSVPVLVVYGSRDERNNVPVRRSVDRLAEAREASGNRNFTIRVLEKTGHNMEDPESGRIRTEYLDLLSSWIMTQVA